MRFPLGTDGFSPEFSKNRPRSLQWIATCFLRPRTYTLSHRQPPDRDHSPNRSYRSGRLSCREVEK